MNRLYDEYDLEIYISGGNHSIDGLHEANHVAPGERHEIA